jgi:hypothetical protein
VALFVADADAEALGVGAAVIVTVVAAEGSVDREGLAFAEAVRVTTEPAAAAVGTAICACIW